MSQPFPRFPTLKIPVLHLARLVGGGNRLTIYTEALDYCALHPQRSVTWHRNIVKILGLAWDFHVAMTGDRGSGNLVTDARRFAQCVRFGTIIFDGTEHSDPSELYWRAPSEHLGRNLLKGLQMFLSEAEVDFATSGDPFSLFLSSMQSRKAPGTTTIGGFNFLSHLSQGKNDPAAATKTLFGVHRDALQDGIERAAPPRFPEDLWLPLLQYGHIVDESHPNSLTRCDATGRAHAALLSLGLRQSTPLHLWLSDVAFSPHGLARVTLRHPEEFFERSTGKKRKHILQEMGLTPRNRVHGRFHAGWKNLKLDKGYFAQTMWLPGSHELGSAILKDYILNVREPVMAERRELGLLDHPFLLVSTAHDPSKNQLIGDPYTRKAAIGSWLRAVGRLSSRYPDRDLRVKKELGTTMHGARHLMGFKCVEAGLALADIANVLHQRSPLSALVYTRRSAKEISDALNKASPGNAETSDETVNDLELLRSLRVKSIAKGVR